LGKKTYDPAREGDKEKRDKGKGTEFKRVKGQRKTEWDKIRLASNKIGGGSKDKRNPPPKGKTEGGSEKF